MSSTVIKEIRTAVGSEADGGQAWEDYRSRTATLVDRVATEADVALFERACGFEQYLSDILATLDVRGTQLAWREGRDAIQRRAVELAGALWFGRRLQADWAPGFLRDLAELPSPADLDRVWRTQGAQERTGLFEYLEMWPVWPECLSSEPVDYGSYAEQVMAAVREMPDPPTAVLGLRSSGSYLGPIWAAALGAAGCEAQYRTVRPVHRTLSAEGDARAPSGDRHDLTALAGTPVVIVDDLVGTGTTIRQAIAELGGIGTDSRDIRVSTYRHAAPQKIRAVLGIDRSRFIGVADVYRAWPQARPEAPDLGSVADYLQRALTDGGCAAAVRDISPLPLSHLIQTLAELTQAPIPRITEHIHGIVRNRRYRLTLAMPGADDMTVVAKPIGFGVMTEDEASRLCDLPHYAPVLGIYGGYLLYEWVDGQALPFRERHGAGAISPGDLDVIAAVAASTGRDAPGYMSLPAATAKSRIHLAVAELRRRGLDLLPDPDAVFSRLTESRISVVVAAPNIAHWHYVRRATGELVKMHRDIANTNRRSDPVEDLAGAAIELGLRPDELIDAAGRYGELTGERPSIGRLSFAVIQHVARALREHDTYTGRLADVIAGPRRARECGADARARGIRLNASMATEILEWEW